jgi:phosphotransacetylase
MRAVAEAADAGIVVPILIGPAARMTNAAKDAGVDIAAFRVIDVPTATPPPRSRRARAGRRSRAADEGLASY